METSKYCSSYFSPGVLDKHHGPRGKNSPRAVRDLDVYPRVQADNKLLRGSRVEVEVVISWRFTKLDALWKYPSAVARGGQKREPKPLGSNY